MDGRRILAIDDEPGTRAAGTEARRRDGIDEDAVTALKRGVVEFLRTFGVTDRDDHGTLPPRLGLAGLTVREMERRLIVHTLERTKNNRTQAARLLGISIRTLRNKLAEYRSRGDLVLARESEN